MQSRRFKGVNYLFIRRDICEIKGYVIGWLRKGLLFKDRRFIVIIYMWWVW